jgi:hypothetical protein
VPDLTLSVPTILYMEPSLSTDSVDTLPTIMLVFSTDMKPSSVNNSIAVNTGLTLLPDGSDTGITVDFISYSNRRLRFKPTTSLSPGIYRVIVEAKANGFVNLTGRPLSTTKSFAFSVGGTPIQLEEIIPVSPSNGGVVTSLPTLRIYAPTVPSTGSTVVEFEVSDAPYFTTLTWNGSITTSGSGYYASNLNPSLFLSDRTYYWRARLKNSVQAGAWTDVQNFYFGSELQVFADSRRNIPDPPEFQLVNYLESDLYDLIAWPSLVFTFTNPVATSGASGWTFDSSLLQFTEVDVNGGHSASVAGSWTVLSATGIQFLPTDVMPKANTRYTIKIPDNALYSVSGDALEYFEVYFTGKYTPLYAVPLQLRAIFGSLVSDVSDDLLAYHLYRASLEANWRNTLLTNVTLDPLFYPLTPKTAQLEYQTMDDYYTVHLWVMYEAMIQILQLKLYEFVPSADGKLEIADYAETISSANILKFLTDQIKWLRQKQKEYEAFFSRRMAKPRAGLKASRFGMAVEDIFDRGFDGRKRF